jgi:undecaprenyl-diphosphatase
MPWHHALLLGIVEALTEFLPVSSTGHLLLVNAALGHTDDSSKTLSIVIQLGAVLAVVVYFRKLLANLMRGLQKRDARSVRLVMALGIAFIPAAIAGLLFHDAIEDRLFGPKPVAWALVVGGVLMIAVDQWNKRRTRPIRSGIEHVGWQRALTVGLAQVASLWPGASRSMTTILGGQVSGLDAATAAEFSFLLSIPVLGAATLFSLAKGWKGLAEAPGGVTALGIGMVTAFVVSLLVISGFLKYLRRFGLAPFGVYRIVLGVIVLVFMAK